jgi:hypothetical protein
MNGSLTVGPHRVRVNVVAFPVGVLLSGLERVGVVIITPDGGGILILRIRAGP